MVARSIDPNLCWWCFCRGAARLAVVTAVMTRTAYCEECWSKASASRWSPRLDQQSNDEGEP